MCKILIKILEMSAKLQSSQEASTFSIRHLDDKSISSYDRD